MHELNKLFRATLQAKRNIEIFKSYLLMKDYDLRELCRMYSVRRELLTGIFKICSVMVGSYAISKGSKLPAKYRMNNAKTLRETKEFWLDWVEKFKSEVWSRDPVVVVDVVTPVIKESSPTHNKAKVYFKYLVKYLEDKATYRVLSEHFGVSENTVAIKCARGLRVLHWHSEIYQLQMPSPFQIKKTGGIKAHKEIIHSVINHYHSINKGT